MVDPLVSFVVTSYNQDKYIIEALESIRMQSYKNFECIVVDNGSVDDSVTTIKKYCIDNNRFQFCQTYKTGASRARNIGLSKCKGKYIQLLDGDDWIEKDKILNQVSFLESNPGIDLVYSDILYFSTQKENIKNRPVLPRVNITENHNLVNELIAGNIFTLHSPLFKKVIVDSGILFDENLITMEDWDFWLRMALKGYKFRYNKANFSASFYRIGHKSLSSNHFNMLKYNLVIRKKNHSKLNDGLKMINKQLADETYSRYLKLIYYESLEKNHLKNYYYLLKVAVYKIQFQPIKYFLLSIYYFLKDKYRNR